MSCALPRAISLLFSIHHLCFHVSLTFHVGLVLKMPLTTHSSHSYKPEGPGPSLPSSALSEGSSLSFLSFYCNISTPLLWFLFFSIPLTFASSNPVSKSQILSLLSCVYNLYWLVIVLGQKSKILGVVCSILHDLVFEHCSILTFPLLLASKGFLLIL